MTRSVRLVFPQALFRRLTEHLFPGDGSEHAAVIAAGLAETAAGPRLLARELWLAREPEDYRIGNRGYMGLQAPFIHHCITYCRDHRLVYLAIHNHGGSGYVAFSPVDMASHERGYRALLDIANGMPVGALVLAEGALEVDLWHPNGSRSALHSATILGTRFERYYANSTVRTVTENDHIAAPERFARQILFLGSAGQNLFKQSKVAVIGLGGIGSIVSEYLARLGVGSLVLIDPDRLEVSNVSRVVGARPSDLASETTRAALKVDIAARVAREAQASIKVETVADDFAREPVARCVLDCDFMFLAADSMRSRLVFNAIVNQYYIPGVQLGTKVLAHPQTGRIESAFSVIRHVMPGEGCLVCNHLVDAAKLAEEWKSDTERVDQQYGLSIPNPSVITMNAVAAAHGVNDFLFAYTGLGTEIERAPYRRYDHLTTAVIQEHPRRDLNCTECSVDAISRLGYGDARALPCSL